MATNKNKSKLRTKDRVLSLFGLIITVVLVGLGCLGWWGYTYATNNVHNELAAQQIFFPTKGSSALTSSKIGPFLNKYAGDQLVNGPEARAYADHFIAVHLESVANGQTYAQVSALAQKSPNNANLQNEANTLFKGETLRGLLLNAYAFWTVGEIAGIVALLLFALGCITLLLTWLGFWRASIV